jgi:polysaccharide deacetylase 2 family uncharacterized protein YibQ
MPRNSNKSSRNERAPRRVRLFVAALVVLAVGGATTVKFLQSTRGAIFLVDHGVESALPRVERDVAKVLKRSLERNGLRRNIRVKSESNPVEWDIPCEEATDLLLVNVGLTEAVRAVGATVRRGEQTDRGRTLLFDVGTPSRDTHKLTIRRLAPAALAAQKPTRIPKLAIVIDDLGYNEGGIAREIVDLEFPVTVAVLPELRHSADVLARAKKRGRCVLLHLPMEASQRYPEDLEPITVDMSDAEIASLVGEYMESLPDVDGVNNHQGSRATADTRVMRAVCRALASHDVFFLDSLTSPESVAYNVALNAGLRASVNNGFLDDETDRSEDVEARLRELIRVARERGAAIGIGHPHPWTLEALQELPELLATSDVELVSLCELMEAENRQ